MSDARDGDLNDFNIVRPLARTAQAMPDAPAVAAGATTLSYGELAQTAARLAGLLAPRLTSRRVGILASRSPAAYAGIAGAAWAGATYVPLNLKWPKKRLIALLARLELDALVVDRNGAELIHAEVRAAAPELILRAGDACAIEGSLALDAVDAAPLAEPVAVGPRHTAYIMFTSGTTGMPKGVVVSAASLADYLRESRKWACFTASDRVAEAHDVTFDLSVHNAFLAFEAGASLHLMSALDMMAPARFIRSRAITCWMSVPTIVAMMRQSGQLKPDIFPSLRLSVFCGEPLPLDAVTAWAEAAPASVVENIYGPTECTVACTRQRLTNPPVVTEKRRILAIGRPYGNVRVALFDRALRPVVRGDIGEIALTSAQLADGYLDAPEQTADRFRMIDGERWYLTGDLGLQDADGVFHHMGRTDNQIKLKGNRVELEEVEMHLRRACGTDLATVVAWPVVDGSAQGLVAFAANATADAKAAQAAMADTLPRYMVPERIEYRDALPQNANGKTDRNALFAELEAGSKGPGAQTPPLAADPVPLAEETETAR